MKLSVKFCFVSLFILFSNKGFTHPMPNSLIILNIHDNHITGIIKLPLSELQSAIGMAVNDNHDKLIERLGDSLSMYMAQHIRPKTLEGKSWYVEIGEMRVSSTQDKLVGDYNELEVNFKMAPPIHYDLRHFYFDYDVILHQVASHRAMINIKQDWQQGIVTEDSTMQQIGIIEWDVVNNKLPIFQVNLQSGSNWKGFKTMISLGISHIKDGTDHILFVLTLLFPAMLFAENRNWAKTIGIRESLFQLLKIITAFTIGHSLTLVLGSLEWLKLPIKPIEILIAFTILISALHALRPIYPQKEMIVAGSFGLIHGLAFSETLKNLDLSAKQMLLSIFGFNIGIELMQMVVIVLVFPILLLLSTTRYYSAIRQIGSVIMMCMAMFWLYERIY